MTLEAQLLLAIGSGIALLLVLIIWVKLNAFLALLMAAMWVGLWGGLPPAGVIDAIKTGMGGTLGFVATIVGLGAIFGAILEHSGGAQALAHYLLQKAGAARARLALLFTGFIISIPVFFDVGIIILFPIVKALARRVGKNTLYFALPLMTGLAVTHSFIPPTPGPVAVADILQVDLGYAILVGLCIGIPVAGLCGLLFSGWLAKGQSISKEEETEEEVEVGATVLDAKLVRTIFWVLGIPLSLILGGSLVNTLAAEGVLAGGTWVTVLSFLGHPFTALVLATLLALYLLGTRRGLSRQELFQVSQQSLAPAGSIILITGAGGVLKQVMVNTGIGELIGQAMASSTFSLVLLAWLVALLVRVMQGSATVAMLTAAGIVAAIIPGMPLGMLQKTLLMMAIAAGSVTLSHVNDSGFWLVNRYLNQTVPQTLRSWTVLSGLISLTAFVLIFLAYQLV